MTPGENIDFKPLRDEGLSSEANEKMVDIIESALESLSKPGFTIDQQAKDVAAELRKRFPPGFTWQPDEDLLTNAWETLVSIVKLVPSRHEGQVLLVTVLKELDSAEDKSPWNGLPYLGECMRDNWIDPTFEPDDEGETYTEVEWLNLNSFVARLLGEGLVGWENFAIWQLRQGLEHDITANPNDDGAPPTSADCCRFAVASEWLIQASPDLLRRCLRARELDKAKKASYRTGPLFAGPPGLDLERWGFWKRRLGELRDVVVAVGPTGDTLAETLDEAAASMTAAQTALWATCSNSNAR